VPPFVVPAISSFICLALVERGALDEAEAVMSASGCGPELPEVLHITLPSGRAADCAWRRAASPMPW
jgi:hypothetical protein